MKNSLELSVDIKQIIDLKQSVYDLRRKLRLIGTRDYIKCIRLVCLVFLKKEIEVPKLSRPQIRGLRSFLLEVKRKYDKSAHLKENSIKIVVGLIADIDSEVIDFSSGVEKTTILKTFVN